MNIDERIAKRYLSTRESARSRDLDFNLTLTSIKNLVNAKRCGYTGIELTFETNKLNSHTIDRIDNNKGYVIGNVIACCKQFNELKGRLTRDDINKILRMLDKK